MLDAKKTDKRVWLGVVHAIYLVLVNKIARRALLDIQSAAVRALRMSALKVHNRPTEAAGRQHAEDLDIKRDLLQVRHSSSIPPHGFHAFGVFRKPVNAEPAACTTP